VFAGGGGFGRGGRSPQPPKDQVSREHRTTLIIPDRDRRFVLLESGAFQLRGFVACAAIIHRILGGLLFDTESGRNLVSDPGKTEKAAPFGSNSRLIEMP
jgi:hypothetical protein